MKACDEGDEDSGKKSSNVSSEVVMTSFAEIKVRENKNNEITHPFSFDTRIFPTNFARYFRREVLEGGNYKTCSRFQILAANEVKYIWWNKNLLSSSEVSQF